MDHKHLRRARTPNSASKMSEELDGPSYYSPTGEKMYTLKFVVTGARSVGKTQLASRITRGEFRESSIPTVGMEFATRSLRYAEHSGVNAQIWDTCSKIPFKSMTEAFFRGAVGAMLVYDISRRSSFDDLVQYLAVIRENCHESIALILVGNKSDMSSKQREVSMMEGMRFARKHGLDFLETSALLDKNVEEATRQLIMSVARYLPREKSVWSVKNSEYPLPVGWVSVTVSSTGGESEDANFTERLATPCVCSAMPPPPPKPKPNSVSSSRSVSADASLFVAKAPSGGNVVMYENTWTGDRVAQRPLYPAGPSDVCVVSQVPRPLDPLTFLADPVKVDNGRDNAGEDRGLFRMIGLTPSWSFSSLKSKGYAAASDCLSKCIDA